MKKRKVKGKTKPKVKVKVKPKAKVKVKPKPKPKVKPKAKVKVKPKPKLKVKAKPRVKPKVKPKVKVRVKPKPKPKVKVTPKVKVKVTPKVKKVKVTPKVKVKVTPPAKPKVKAVEAEKVGEEDVLKLIRSGKKGFLQNELWKKLGIDSRACSRFLASLEARGLIKREPETFRGIRTYRIAAVKQIPELAKPKAVDHHLLMVKDIVAPCVGCKSECDPELCSDLSVWVHLLH